MQIQIHFDRTDGANAMGRVVAIILDTFEAEPTRTQIFEALGDAAAGLEDDFPHAKIVRLE